MMADYTNNTTRASVDRSENLFMVFERLLNVRLSISDRTAALLIVVAVIAVRGCALMTTSIDADEGVYLVIAQQWLRGGLPYIAVWDQHPPGLPAIFAAVLTVIPDPVLGVRLAASVAVAGTAWLLYRFCVRYADSQPAGLIAALFYIFCISRWPGLSANTEIFNNLIVTFAAYQLYGGIAGRPNLWRPFVAALALGIGLQIKYVILPECILLPLGYLFSLQRRMRDLRMTASAGALMIVAGCVPTAVAVLYFWLHGALRPFVEANIGANVTYVGLLPTVSDVLLGSASGLLPIATAVLIIVYAIVSHRSWRPRGDRLLTMHMWILLWILAAALDVCLPMKFFRHYFHALYPPVCLAGALAVTAIAAGRRRRLAAYCLVALFATAVPLWADGSFRAAPWSAEDVPTLIAERVLKAGASDGDLYVYRYQPSVYALAGLRPPTPYVMTLELSEFSESAHVDGITEMNRILAAGPRFIVKPEAAAGGLAAPVDDVLARYLKAYQLIGEFRDQADRSVVQLYEHGPGCETGHDGCR